MQRKTRDEAECRENVRVTECVCVWGEYISSRHPTHPPFYPLLVFVCVCVCVRVRVSDRHHHLQPGNVMITATITIIIITQTLTSSSALTPTNFILL